MGRWPKRLLLTRIEIRTQGGKTRESLIKSGFFGGRHFMADGFRPRFDMLTVFHGTGYNLSRQKQED